MALVEFSRTSNVVCHVCVPEEHVPLGEAGSIALFRIVQEALTNVVRHAKAKHVFITLEHTDDGYVLDIRDDGKGFDPVASRRKSFGLAGMKERALMLGARSSSPVRRVKALLSPCVSLSVRRRGRREPSVR